MIEITFKLKSASPLIYGKPVSSVKETGESYDSFENRTWPEKIHQFEHEAIIPSQAVKNTLTECAKFLSESVPGKGKATYTKHFEAGIMVMEPIYTGIKADSISSMRLFVPADGRKGGSTRVWKHFPVLNNWTGEAKVLVLDPMLETHPEKIFEYFVHAGKFIGFLTFRPRKGGEYGRFEVSEKYKINKVLG